MQGGIPYRYKRLLQGIGITLVVWLILKYLLPLVIPFLLAYWIVTLLSPMTSHMEKHLHLSRSISTAILLGAIGVIIICFVFLLGDTLLSQVRELIANSDYYIATANGWLQEQTCRIETMFGMMDGSLLEFITGTGAMLVEALRTKVIPDMLVSKAYPLITLGAELGALGLVTITAAILLSNKGDQMAEALQKHIFGEELLRLLMRLNEVAGTYIRVQGLIMLCVFGVCLACFFLLQMPYGAILSLVIAIVDALPLFGSGTILIPWCIISLITGKFVRAAALLTLYLVCYFLREFMETHLMGRTIGIGQLATLAAMYVGLQVFGLFGLFLGPIGLIMWKEIDNFISVS